MTRNPRQFLAYATAIVWAGTCVAAEPTVPASLRACAAIRLDVERHACYDREMAKLLPGAAGADAAAAVASTAAPAPVLTPEQRFGLSPAQAETKVAEVTKAEPLQSLKAKVSGVRPITEGRVLIDLDNGQVWRQVDTDVTGRLQPGDAVTKGAPLLILEAMKMEHTIAAPADGIVSAVNYGIGDQVQEGADLIDLDEAPALKSAA